MEYVAEAIVFFFIGAAAVGWRLRAGRSAVDVIVAIIKGS
jgi:hypothetical protein